MTSPWPRQRGDLLFREAGPADLDALLSLRNDARVNDFMVRTSVEPEELRREWLAVPDSDSDYSCVVERDGALVALGFLDVLDSAGQPGAPARDEGLIGYIVDPDVAGQGVGTATARSLLTAAFETLRLRRVRAAAFADNTASVAVLERVGMRQERHSRAALWHARRGWSDEVEYAMLAEEWAERGVR